ncbi:MAG: carboxypeptidase regulatory-like domain-containing protein [Elusimicrobia bacterium]|nr:carboxypeptidase regulatory-like domain-containing protein [Elusimicrobiota bacterium]
MGWVKCQGCGAQIDPSATSCPVCLRPRSRPEIMRGIIELQKGPLRRRRSVLRVFLALGCLAGVALTVWNERAWMAPHYRAYRSFFVTWLGLDQYPFTPDNKAAQPAGQAAASAPPSEAPSLVTAPPPTAPMPEPVAEPPKTSTTAAGAPASPDHWALRGLVYDLYTLKPVAKAELTFTSRATGKALRSRTDGKGDFTLRLPRLTEGGYDITVRHPRYLDNFLEEYDPPYKTMSPERRQHFGAMFLQSEVLHVPYLPSPDEDRPHLDMVLMPR